jgi:hypothetical protein
MWRKFFILNPGHFIMPGIGEFDSSKDISEEMLLEAFRKGCPFVFLTPDGKKKYGIDVQDKTPKKKFKPKTRAIKKHVKPC